MKSSIKYKQKLSALCLIELQMKNVFFSSATEISMAYDYEKVGT